MDYCCSFCGKPRSAVRTLVSGPSVFICDECIFLCIDVLEEQGIAIPRRQKAAAPKRRQPQPASQRIADIVAWCKESLSLQQLWPPAAGREERAELLPKELLAPGGPLDQRPVHVFEVSDIGLQISQILSGGVRMVGTVRNATSTKSANFVGEDGWLIVCEFDPPR